MTSVRLSWKESTGKLIFGDTPMIFTDVTVIVGSRRLNTVRARINITIPTTTMRLKQQTEITRHDRRRELPGFFFSTSILAITAGCAVEEDWTTIKYIHVSVPVGVVMVINSCIEYYVPSANCNRVSESIGRRKNSNGDVGTDEQIKMIGVNPSKNIKFGSLCYELNNSKYI